MRLGKQAEVIRDLKNPCRRVYMEYNNQENPEHTLASYRVPVEASMKSGLHFTIWGHIGREDVFSRWLKIWKGQCQSS